MSGITLNVVLIAEFMEIKINSNYTYFLDKFLNAKQEKGFYITQYYSQILIKPP